MQVVGRRVVSYDDKQAGGGVCFPADAVHRTAYVAAPTTKITLFFGEDPCDVLSLWAFPFGGSRGPGPKT